MAQYYRVSPSFWRGRRGWGDREKLFAFYLLSCPHRNLEGLYWLPLAYIQADLGWRPRDVEDALQVVERDRFASYDHEAQVVFVRKALSYQAPSTDNQVKGAVVSLERVPETTLWAQFLDACRQWAPKLFPLVTGMRSECDAHAIREGSLVTPISHAHRSPEEKSSDSHIACDVRTHDSNSNSNSNPPNPPKGGRARDQQKWRDELDVWVQAHPVSDDLVDEWEHLVEPASQLLGMVLGYLHPHRLGDAPVLGVARSSAIGALSSTQQTELRRLLGREFALIDCRCELTREHAA